MWHGIGEFKLRTILLWLLPPLIDCQTVENSKIIFHYQITSIEVLLQYWFKNKFRVQLCKEGNVPYPFKMDLQKTWAIPLLDQACSLQPKTKPKSDLLNNWVFKEQAHVILLSFVECLVKEIIDLYDDNFLGSKVLASKPTSKLTRDIKCYIITVLRRSIQHLTTKFQSWPRPVLLIKSSSVGIMDWAWIGAGWNML